MADIGCALVPEKPTMQVQFANAATADESGMIQPNATNQPADRLVLASCDSGSAINDTSFYSVANLVTGEVAMFNFTNDVSESVLLPSSPSTTDSRFCTAYGVSTSENGSGMNPYSIYDYSSCDQLIILHSYHQEIGRQSASEPANPTAADVAKIQPSIEPLAGRKSNARVDPEGVKPSSLATRRRSERRLIPEVLKDGNYHERRLRNNEAARRSREQKRLREAFTQDRCNVLERENATLRAQVDALKDEAAALRGLILQRNTVVGLVTVTPCPSAPASPSKSPKTDKDDQ